MKIFLLTGCLLFALYAGAQHGNGGISQAQLSIKKATGKIIIDGILDEPDWQLASVAGSFKLNFPYDTSYAEKQTEARVTFDDKFLYISAVCYQPKKYIVQSLRRDYPNSSSDIFFVLIDPFQDKLNGFYFAVTPYGVQKEGLLYTGSGGSDNNFDWDNKWYSEATRHDDKYIVEIAIPFKTLRYKLAGNNINEWNLILKISPFGIYFQYHL